MSVFCLAVTSADSRCLRLPVPNTCPSLTSLPTQLRADVCADYMFRAGSPVLNRRAIDVMLGSFQVAVNIP
jgi:hypothetical protein